MEPAQATIIAACIAVTGTLVGAGATLRAATLKKYPTAIPSSAEPIDDATIKDIWAHQVHMTRGYQDINVVASIVRGTQNICWQRFNAEQKVTAGLIKRWQLVAVGAMVSAALFAWAAFVS
jgi:hypothetical protein